MPCAPVIDQCMLPTLARREDLRRIAVPVWTQLAIRFGEDLEQLVAAGLAEHLGTADGGGQSAELVTLVRGPAQGQ